MTRAKKQDLTWFDLKNYNFINNLNLPGLIKELEWRCFLLDNVNDSSFILDEEYEIKYERIFSGDPNLDVENKEEQELSDAIYAVNESIPSLRNLYGELPSLASGGGVHPITFSELCMYSFSSVKQGFFKWDESDTYIKSNAMLASVTGNIEGCLTDCVLTSINLGDATDDEIITTLSRLLPLWRKQLKINEGEHVSPKKIGIRTLQKLVSNRVLPIIDILLWGERFDKEITNPMLSALAFSDDPKDTQSIKESIKPFALEAISEQYTRLLWLYANKNKEISDLSIFNLMSREL